jgi:hypothetical protein
MAQKVLVQLVDDLDGTSSDSIETVVFGLDGVTYEIDLADANASRLRDNLAEFVASARRTGGRVKRGTASATPRGAAASASGRSKEQTQAIRDWARNNGYDVSERGRIPGSVLEAFESAHASGSAPVKGKRAKKSVPSPAFSR